MAGRSKGNRNRKSKERETAVTDPTMIQVSPEDARKQTIIGVIVVALVIALIGGIMTWRIIAGKQDAEQVATSQGSAYDIMNSSSTDRPSDYLTKDGAFVVTKDGVVKDPATVVSKLGKNVKIVDTYVDLNCPGCGAVDRSLNRYYQQYLENGKIALRVHLIAFLNNVSSDQYSERAANAVYRMLDVAPDKTLDYMTYLLSDGVQPGEGAEYKSFTDKDLQAAAVKVGVDQGKVSTLTDKKYDTYVTNVTTYVVNDKDLWKENATSFTTPIVLVDGKQLTFDDSGAFINQFIDLINK
jgi:protein-disulfide isomerase